jgi:PAS domain S-box-containing protein
MNQDARIDQLLSLVLELANGNLDARLEPTSRSEPLDGVVEGLNMLAEELSASTAALKRSEESFRSLIERSPDAIFVHREGRFVYVNATALVLLGHRDPQDLMGSAVQPLLEPEPSQQVLARIVRDDRPATRDGQLVHRNGTKVDVEVVSIPVNFDGHAATLSIARDISGRKQLTAKMMEMDRMIAVGTLAAGVGHEINNPLAYVVSNLDFALETLRPATKFPAHAGAVAVDAALRQALLEAREGAERVRQIVRDLRTFSSTPAKTSTTFELVPVVESALHMAFNEIRHRAQLVRDYDDDIPMITGYSSRLGQVFLNLIVNAAHAIPVGTANDHRITVRIARVQGLLKVEVSDTGVGIEPEHLARLFDPFFTTKPPGQGTGLGLFICLRIVHEHQGEIEVQSQPGMGTTFSVFLPAAEHARQGNLRPEAAKPGKPISLKRARVLVVDDEPGIGRSLARSLGRDHEVSTVTCARDALDLLLESDAYDAVLCDVMMPEMTGVELYAELERYRPDLAERVLFFTGGAFTPATQAFVQQMAERCLEKPFDICEIRRKLAELCALPRSVGIVRVPAPPHELVATAKGAIR